MEKIDNNSSSFLNDEKFLLFRISHIKKFVIFCFVGGTSAIIHLIIFNIFFKLFNITLQSNIVFFGASIDYILATIIAIFTSIIYNFSMNRNITFAAKHETVKKQLPKYAVVYSISICINFIVSLILINILGENTINANIATFCGIVASIPISFIGSLLWTFKKKN